MNKKINIICIYNSYMLVSLVFLLLLPGIWSLEAESDYTYGRTGGLPFAAIAAFLPEVVLGLKWGIDKRFTLVCSTFSGIPSHNGLFLMQWMNGKIKYGMCFTVQGRLRLVFLQFQSSG